jgi:hypothetical protein
MDVYEQLCHEIIETRLRFHQLLDTIPDRDFSWPSDNPAWTIGEVLYHMSLAPRLVIADVRMITGQTGLYRLIPRLVPKRLFDWVNARMTRYGARHLSRSFLAREYDKAHEIALRALGRVAEGDFQRRAIYPDWDPLLSGEVTLERLFHYMKEHFDAHAAEIERVLKENT